jgi:glycosyltransferase involved in cell wall biosynthesis
MLSILIPTYHYNAYPLALQLENQALKANITFELICLDDGSFSHLNIENQKINNLTNCKFIEAKKNIGRTASRQFLAEQAQYNWLLFLDADTIPASNNFIDTLIKNIHSNYQVIFGGIAYMQTKPESDRFLRWYYGKERETKPVEERLRKPYQSLISGAFTIKKELFLTINSKFLNNAYGMDILFAHELRILKTPVKHINNQVFHLGIEKSSKYLIKSKSALHTLSVMLKNKSVSQNATNLLKTYNKLYRIGLASLFGKLMLIFNSYIEKNLTGPTPNLFLFDLYRLGYFCRIHK